ncbi:MAG: CbiX/SirB N-terminal domain-containing protein [Verrucomicrobiales bacterium]
MASCIILTDNGSLRPEATFSLRRLAKALGERIGKPIHAVSLLHSGRIDADKLDGKPADTFEKFVLAKREEGVDEFLVVPLFFGPSAAIAEYLPQRVDVMREEQGWTKLTVRVAPCLVNLKEVDDYRVAQMLADHVLRKHASLNLSDKPSVALVDHGTPRKTVTDVRNHLATQLGELLGDKFHEVKPCSMERRESKEYDYNEPLLEHLLGSSAFHKEVIVSMLFLQPGRHAGEGGDVAEICEAAEKANPGLTTHITDLLGLHPRLLDLLEERLAQGKDLEPVCWQAITQTRS